MIRDLLAIVDCPDQSMPFLDGVLAFAEHQQAEAEVTLLTPGPLASPALAPFGALYVPEPTLEAEEAARLAVLRGRCGSAPVTTIVHGLRDDVAWLAGDLRHRRQIVDLILIGGAEGWALPWLRRRVIETLLLAAGTPVVLVPRDRHLTRIRRAVIGWTPSPEAARAVHDLVRLAEPGAEIDIVTITGHHPADEPSAAEVQRHLARHGFVAHVHAFANEDRLEADLLQKYALDAHADLLALGGFAHSRVREIALGGVTRTLIAETRLPVLLSH
ncbi:universal stress protein [Sphingomonas hengshuiensis]|uniref:Universal stress protein UspA n=1 Tax=Sphingomonas hengshuiensis TaxID=1609977 RepID=A0A7U4J7U0_9SPHN|nr:universal stress protein [Sphingomonas hengshuiensis]AJP71813.1 universal stress protein UspA [Sphingomonas hengshuiensis]